MAIVRGLTSLVNVKLSLGLPIAANAALDTDMEAYISAATPVIEDITGPMYAESRTVYFDGGTAAVSLPFRFNAVTTVTVSGTATTNYVANVRAGVIYAGGSTSPTTFEYGTQNVVVVVTVGYATIPPNIELAARELVRHWWQIGRQGVRPDVQGAPDAAPVAQGFAVPRRVTELCAPHARLAGFA